MTLLIRRLPVAFLLAVLSFAGYSFAASMNELSGQVGGNFVFDDDDEIAEITDRVARVSIVDGEAKIRRNGADEWEKVTANLPLVEGDEISTESGTRIEIQFDKDRHLRLDENSFLKIASLKDTGIAISLSVGRASLRATTFDKDRSFFEIDGPKTTVAIQKAGRYFIDAGETGGSEVLVSIDEGGEARVYSDSAGFTLKDRRSARIFIDGANAGEWETSAAISDSGDFAAWVTDREETVARRLQNSFYNKYYDQDIYGADDLSDNGDWINTDDYGYVWRPSRLATAQYSNWSPYRYGHWRWMPPFGWVWVNDEPWGWATYHHGRWFMHNGGWVWSPYGYYRSRRSWWSPALVVINIYNNNVCWYPIPYHRRRHNFNAHYQKKGFKVVRNPQITPPGPTGPRKGKGDRVDPIDGIVTADANEFGRRNIRVKTAPEPIAKIILTKRTDEVPPVLPEFKTRRMVSDLTVEKPLVDPVMQTRVGAGPKRTDGALDGELQKTRIFGGRVPQKQPETDATTTVRSSEPRKTGVADRPAIVRQPTDPVKEPNGDPEPVRQPPTRRVEPIYTPPTRDDRPTPKQTPRYDPPPRQPEKTRETPSPVKQQPRIDPPPAKSETKPAPSRKGKPDSL